LILQAKQNADQFELTIASAIQHFGTEYGDTLIAKGGVEFAPKFDYEILEKENKEVMKVYEPLNTELKKMKKNQKII
jgi:hypothetical protein